MFHLIPLLLYSIEITLQGVIKILATCDSNKSPNPDKISPLFLKNKANEIAPMLAHLFQQSLTQGIYHLPGNMHMFLLFLRKVINQTLWTIDPFHWLHWYVRWWNTSWSVRSWSIYSLTTSCQKFNIDSGHIILWSPVTFNNKWPGQCHW